MTKRELQDSARELIQTDPNKSVEISLNIYQSFPDEFNNYDAVNLLQAARKAGNTNVPKLSEIIAKFSDNEIVYGICGWYIFDNYIKKKSPQQILQYENVIAQFLPILKQKDVSINDQYPCPFYLIVSNLWSAHSNNLFNANKIFYYCTFINPDFLSKKSSSYTTDEGKDVAQASSYEEYFQYYTKACDKLNRAEETISSCKIALSTISEFHYDNDLWFKMRIARAHSKLNDYTAAEKIYLEIINSRAGNTKYFLYKEFSELLYTQQRYKESWKYSLRSGVILRDVQFSSGLLLLQSRLLGRLNRIEEANKFAEIIYAGIKEELWNSSNDYQKLINYFKIQNVSDKANTLFKNLYSFYKDELYDDALTSEGKIVFIHKNGKFGKIKYNNEDAINFTKNSFNKRAGRLEKFVEATVSFVSDYDYNASPIAENIKVTTFKKPAELVGKEFKGRIQNIVDFGMFVDFDSDKTGLVHISVLNESFKEEYNIGDTVHLKVTKETNKGFSLKLLEKL
ncbi:hypothetical protein JCM19275_3170 [Nonlabens ulvanivorans]|uniref:S1 motif domain-containing protein n=1 Tax=Nonlabens ulvanivorans TaxID=906888 RepID=A0A090WBD0_NONUL|nr:S1 RNA-binding domain-containing protein [Nonlabens ulvanivorans]GAL74315.1 hypothetical protein JCM19275_3170 [Nonlabens ulvanivorans]